MGKSFVITIDTEGDNLWEWKWGTSIETNNTYYLPRFQELCNKYGFIPTWLVNWEMANDDRFVDYTKENLLSGQCEIGMHLHAWNMPPAYELPADETSGKPFLIEYPSNVMREKIECMTDLLEEKFGHRPVVHRAGRWIINDQYLKILVEQGYIADCSVTPHVDWSKTRGRTPGVYGNNYRDERNNVTKRGEILEVPVSTLWSHRPFLIDKKGIKRKKKELTYIKKGRTIWLRPTGRNLREMLHLVDYYSKSDVDYLEFMIHSSELMPGGSPNFKTETDIDNLYHHMDVIFERISRSYSGIGLEQYAKNKIKELY